MRLTLFGRDVPVEMTNLNNIPFTTIRSTSPPQLCNCMQSIIFLYRSLRIAKEGIETDVAATGAPAVQVKVIFFPADSPSYFSEEL